MTVEPRSGSPCPLDWPDPPAHPSYTSPAADPGHRHGDNCGSRPSATAHPAPPDTRPPTPGPRHPSVEKLDRLGTCLALMAPAGFVALGCHTSVAGPPFTLRGSWTTPRQAHRRSERRTRLSAAGRLISDSPPRSASAWMAAAPLAASRPNTTRALDIPSSDRSRRNTYGSSSSSGCSGRPRQRPGTGVIARITRCPPRASPSTPAGTARRPRRSEIRAGSR